MKTESEIYKACIDAGLKAGDIVRMSDGSICHVSGMDHSYISIHQSGVYYSSQENADTFHAHIGDRNVWPTHYARPILRGKDFAFDTLMGSDGRFCNETQREIIYPTIPDQKSIEERLNVLESKIDQLLTKGHLAIYDPRLLGQVKGITTT